MLGDTLRGMFLGVVGRGIRSASSRVPRVDVLVSEMERGGIGLNPFAIFFGEVVPLDLELERERNFGEYFDRSEGMCTGSLVLTTTSILSSCSFMKPRVLRMVLSLVLMLSSFVGLFNVFTGPVFARSVLVFGGAVVTVAALALGVMSVESGLMGLYLGELLALLGYSGLESTCPIQFSVFNNEKMKKRRTKTR